MAIRPKISTLIATPDDLKHEVQFDHEPMSMGTEIAMLMVQLNADAGDSTALKRVEQVREAYAKLKAGEIGYDEWGEVIEIALTRMRIESGL